MAATSSEQLLPSTDTTARRSAVSRATVCRMITRGELAVIYLGSALRIPVSAIERWLAAQTANSGGG